MFMINRNVTGHMFRLRKLLNKVEYSIRSKALEASNNNTKTPYVFRNNNDNDNDNDNEMILLRHKLIKIMH